MYIYFCFKFYLEIYPFSWDQMRVESIETRLLRGDAIVHNFNYVSIHIDCNKLFMINYHGTMRLNIQRQRQKGL